MKTNDPTDEDRDVMEAFDLKDFRGALQILMERYGLDIYRLCRDLLGDRALAADVQQRVFIEVCRDLPKFERRSSVRTWLSSIARHRLLDAASRRRSRP